MRVRAVLWRGVGESRHGRRIVDWDALADQLARLMSRRMWRDEERGTCGAVGSAWDAQICINEKQGRISIILSNDYASELEIRIEKER